MLHPDQEMSPEEMMTNSIEQEARREMKNDLRQLELKAAARVMLGATAIGYLKSMLKSSYLDDSALKGMIETLTKEWDENLPNI